MNKKKDEKKEFNFEEANLADLLTAIGELEHIYYHACKSAASSKKEDSVYYITVAEMAKDFRRKLMKKHFPDVDEKDWCLIKAADAMRQRIFESAYTCHEDLKAANDLWSIIMEHVFHVDLSGCSACREDKNDDNRRTLNDKIRRDND